MPNNGVARKRRKRFYLERALLNSVMLPQLSMAKRLLRLIRSWSSADQTAEYAIPAIVTFLAGIDKAIGATLLLCYLGGKLTLKEIGDRYDHHGILSCGLYTGKKLKLLQSLGFKVSDLWWYVNLRNQYLHDVSLECGYRIGSTRRGKLGFEVKTTELGLTSFTGGSSVFVLSPEELDSRANELIDQLVKFLAKQPWRQGFEAVNRCLRDAPNNPSPEATSILRAVRNDDEAAIDACLVQLNERLLGRGYANALKDSRGSPNRGLSRRAQAGVSAGSARGSARR